jgi:polyisoprenyl-teichoic acid--peptidoglycan teichoic acid transferase
VATTSSRRSPDSSPSVTVDQMAQSPKPVNASVKPKSKLRWLWIALGLLGVAALSASAGALLAVAVSGTPLMQTKLTSAEKQAFNQGDIASGKNFKLPQLTRPVNILVLGVKVLSSDVDNPPANAQKLGYLPTLNSLEGLSDSMLLLRFNPGSQQLVVLSLPRDTRTYVDGAGVTKLNEANAVGGPALAARSTSDLLGGVGIDRYIRINVLGVEKLIDALGGISVYVPQDMKYQDDSQHLYINLKQGQQHLNGKQAVQFLRFRYDSYGDIGRVQRQQTFLRAMREQALKPSTMARLPQILSVIQSNLDTNLTVEELIALSGFASKIDRSNMQMLMLPGGFSGGEFEASYWLPKPEQIATMVRRYFGIAAPQFADAPEAPQPDPASASHVSIAVQDSTQTDRAVEKLISKLGGAGYGDIYVDQPWAEALVTTRIIAQQGDRDEAKAIQKALGFGEVVVESTGSLESDITIRLGKDALGAAPAPRAEPTESPASTAPEFIESPASTEPAESPDQSEPDALEPDALEPETESDLSGESSEPQATQASPVPSLNASPSADSGQLTASPNQTALELVPALPVGSSASKAPTKIEPHIDPN